MFHSSMDGWKLSIDPRLGSRILWFGFQATEITSPRESRHLRTARGEGRGVSLTVETASERFSYAFEYPRHGFLSDEGNQTIL